MTNHSGFRRNWAGFRLWARRVHLTRKLAFLLLGAVLLAGSLTMAVLTESGPADVSPVAVLILLNVDLALLLLLGLLVARRIARVWSDRRRGGAGSRLHVRFVVLFSAVAVAPAILVAVFSVLFMNIGLEAWFSTRVRTALDASLTVAKSYLEEHKQAISGDIRAMADLINASNENLAANPQVLSRLLENHGLLRDLSEAVVFSRSGRVVARTGFTLSLQFEQVPFWALDIADSGQVAVLASEDNRVRALARLEGAFDGYYLYGGRFVDSRVVGHVERTESAVSQYRMLENRRSDLQITFSLIFILVALLLLLAAIWFGLSVASRLARPIMSLIEAAQKVASGNFGARVEIRPGSDEFGSLIRAFNRMSAQIAIQRLELVEANRELDERRRFTETVLSGVSAGVIGINAAGQIEMPNPSASQFLGIELAALIGRPLVAVWPEVGELLDAVRQRPDRPVQRELPYVREGGNSRTFHLRLAAEGLDGEVIGYVLTFDDITDLQSAQRKAAWADVARRIAHEIKNPLTPIQLAAERLKRKYLKEIATDPDTFVTCTDTIVRQVEDIRRMVNEFSEFARMPAPKLAVEDLRRLVLAGVVLERAAYPEMTFESDLPDEPVPQTCDAHQINRAITNLVKNAVEAIQGRDGRDPAGGLPKGRVRVRLFRRDGRPAIEVEDNGKGLPADNRDRLTEPYVTTRAKGTGLGLAIVKKIMEDHGGELLLEDAAGGGARVTLSFPAAGGEPEETGRPKSPHSVADGA